MGVWIETSPGRWVIWRKKRHTLYGCVDWNISKRTGSNARNMSHPVWVCGLKLASLKIYLFKLSHTLYGCVDWNNKIIIRFVNIKSHTLYGCVDWNCFAQVFVQDGSSHTLYGCVDWNTDSRYLQSLSDKSHPVWVCGLKLLLVHLFLLLLCHTLYGCVDWNFLGNAKKKWGLVTPCMGVWIETEIQRERFRDSGHTLYGCVDWNRCLDTTFHSSGSHTLYGCVDWNAHSAWYDTDAFSHTLYGCVDWNYQEHPEAGRAAGHTLYGCVDWNSKSVILRSSVGLSHPVWVCGLKQ